MNFSEIYKLGSFTLEESFINIICVKLLRSLQYLLISPRINLETQKIPTA